jgi:DNA-binding MarR family transcriptional regulator
VSTEKPLLTTLTRQAHLVMRRRLVADVHAAGFNDLTPAHLYVFQLPGPDGMRPTELAARMKMTKQATNHLLSGLEARGYVERLSTPVDGRVRLLRLTARGRQVARIMQKSSRCLEDQWAHELGRPQIERIRQGLARLVEDTSTG